MERKPIDKRYTKTANWACYLNNEPVVKWALNKDKLYNDQHPGAFIRFTGFAFQYFYNVKRYTASLFKSDHTYDISQKLTISSVKVKVECSDG